MLVQLYAYAGFPRCLNALGAFMQTVDERRNKGLTAEVGAEPGPFPKDGKTVLESGTEVQTALVGAPVGGGLMDFAPAADQFLKTHLFGDIFGRDNLNWEDREITTVAALSTIPGAESQLRSHFSISMNIGVTPMRLKNLTDVLKSKVSQAVGEKSRAVNEWLEPVTDAEYGKLK